MSMNIRQINSLERVNWHGNNQKKGQEHKLKDMWKIKREILSLISRDFMMILSS